jgi:hypothetical protein
MVDVKIMVKVPPQHLPAQKEYLDNLRKLDLKETN